MIPTKVIVHGVLGRMGQEVVHALCREPGLQLVGAVDIQAVANRIPLPNSKDSVLLSSDLEKVIKECKPDVIIDFSTAKAVLPAVSLAVRYGTNMVIGTTGLQTDELRTIDSLAKEYGVGVVVASNFALGAVMMIHLAKTAAKYFDSAEIIEKHHHMKVDAPSGTALTTAKAMADTRGKPFNRPISKEPSVSRGQQIEGIAIHSVRLPGILANQEVILSSPGQTLSIKHDTVNRECYMPGVILATKEVNGKKGLIYGLEKLLGLKGV
ncbi:MAG: 4-hydroxy-tetrahydrodipicolinate reductase [Dehalococcoidia bacterium]|nr:MAG: 4-hydroxy-tetrahydrodipicolinate reductase [Dehalococcoidia bacterium]